MNRTGLISIIVLALLLIAGAVGVLFFFWPFGSSKSETGASLPAASATATPPNKPAQGSTATAAATTPSNLGAPESKLTTPSNITTTQAEQPKEDDEITKLRKEMDDVKKVLKDYHAEIKDRYAKKYIDKDTFDALEGIVNQSFDNLSKMLADLEKLNENPVEMSAIKAKLELIAGSFKKKN